MGIPHEKNFMFTSGKLHDNIFLENFMGIITSDALHKMMPTLEESKKVCYAPLLTASMIEFEINNQKRVSAYLANLAHESTDLTRWEENLNYSARRLMEVWPTRFSSYTMALQYQHDPKKLANRVYGGRMGNNLLNDGWEYRGRFPLQITGKDMYLKASKALGIPQLFTNPESCLTDPMYGFRVSAWLFAIEKGGNHLADIMAFKALVKAINGGYNGLAQRISLYQKGLQIFPTDFKLEITTN